MQPFDLLVLPPSLKEACRALAAAGDEGKTSAGGTSLPLFACPDS